MNIANRKIFRGYDVRGIYPDELDEEIAKVIGKAVGSFYTKNAVNSVVVGKDNRLSSNSLQTALISGLTTAGCNVINVGLSLTPMIYFSWYGLGADGAIEITASHNPANYNGFKVTFKKDIISGEQVLDLITKDDFLTGNGETTSAELKSAYFDQITKGTKFENPPKVVIDCGNGTAGLFAPELFRKLGCQVLEFHCQSDGSFPVHDPNPQHEEYYADMVEKVVKNNFDLGIALDGDADRFNVTDERGIFAGSNLLIALFSKDLLSKSPKASVVVTVICSQAIIDYIEKLGGKVVIAKVGYPNIQRKIRETGAIFAGEESGHLYFADSYFGFDDALYTSVRIADLVARLGKKLSQILTEIKKEIPQYFGTKEMRIACPDELKFEIVTSVSQNLAKNFEVLDIDGVRFQTDGGWGIIRPSNTEPALSIKAEGKTEGSLTEIKKIISQTLEKYKPQVNLVWE